MAYPDVRVYLGLTANAFEDESTWEDVTDWAMTVDCRHGRSSHLDEFQPGGGSVRFRNHDGRFDPANTGGAYYPDLRPRNRIKVEATVEEAVLSDTFPGSAVDTATWTAVGSGGVAVGSGNLTVTSSTSATTVGVATAATVDFYDLSVTVPCQMSATPWPTSVGFFPIEVRMSSGTERAYFELNNGSILALIDTGDEPITSLWSASHSNVTHAWLRVRRAGHTTYWDTSTDGSTWTNRASSDYGWQAPWDATVRAVAVTSSPEGSTDTMTLASYTIEHDATHSLAYGWVDGWPQDQPSRKDAYVDVTFSDALTMLARGAMPDSVYDYVVDSLDPTIWWKLNDTTSVATDYSGNSYHGRYSYYEGFEVPYHGRALPDSIVQNAEADSVIPLAGRPGKSWAAMFAEIGQPIGVPFASPRTPIIVDTYAPLTSGILANTFSFETWLVFRQAYPVNATDFATATTAIPQPIITIGYSWDGQYIIQVDADGDLQFIARATPGGAFGGITGTGANMGDDTDPHHIVVVVSDTAGDMIGTLYVDGAFVANANFGSPDFPGGFFVVGQSEYVGDDRQLQSTLGDVVAYDYSLSAGEVEDLYYAGKFGALTATERLTAGQVIDQALDMAGWQVTSSVDLTGAYVKAETPNRASALEWCRKASKSERGVFYQRPNGEVTFYTRDWQTTLGRARYYHWWFSDSGVTALGHSTGLNVEYDDELMTNDATAEWAGGEQSAVNATSVAQYGRIRKKLDTTLDTAEAARQAAEWEVYAYGNPRLRVTEPLVLEPVDSIDFAAACAVEFGSRVRVTRTTADGRVVVDDYWAEGVRHQIEPGRLAWRTYVTLDKADDPAALFRIDGAVFTDGSALDGTDVLTF
jgi:hypothetical protein